MPALATTNFNIILSVLGGWISLFGLVSYLCKESFYLSEARMSRLNLHDPPSPSMIIPAMRHRRLQSLGNNKSSQC